MSNINEYLSVVIPTGQGREDNLRIVLDSLLEQTYPVMEIVVVCDGFSISEEFVDYAHRISFIEMPKHSPGQQPPRNVGVRELRNPAQYVWFLDSDVFVIPTASEEIYHAVKNRPERVICCPYDWLNQGERDWRNWSNLSLLIADYRWSWFKNHGSAEIFKDDLGAALANFSGNLVWPINLFKKVGGFHPELSAGRVDDGELGLRACSHGIGTSFCSGARGFHLWHPVDNNWVRKVNAKEVPLINKWHPWVEKKGIVLSYEDGARFERICPNCYKEINTLEWWDHSEICA